MPSRRSVLALGALLITTACGRVVSSRSTSSALPSRVPDPTPDITSGVAATPSGPASRPVHTGPAVEVAHGPRTTPAVALTFHGGGDVAYALQILALAEQRHVPLTIFAVGDWLVANPTVAGRILRGGHELGNHTYTHPDNFPSLPAAAMIAEVSRCRDVIRQQTSQTGGYVRPSATVHASAAILTAEGAAGYPVSVSYDVDPLDYDEPGASAVVQRVADGVQAGSIVSLHTGYAGTVAAIPGILDALSRKGLRPVTVSELLA